MICQALTGEGAGDQPYQVFFPTMPADIWKCVENYLERRPGQVTVVRVQRRPHHRTGKVRRHTWQPHGAGPQ